jgi:hypothetical protein
MVYELTHANECNVRHGKLLVVEKIYFRTCLQKNFRSIMLFFYYGYDFFIYVSKYELLCFLKNPLHHFARLNSQHSLKGASDEKCYGTRCSG